MKRIGRIGLRLLGLGLVVLVLTQIQYRDKLEWPDGRVESGRILRVEPGQFVFQPLGAEAPQVVAFDESHGPRLSRGVITILAKANSMLLLLATGVFGPVLLISVVRWRLLLSAVGLPISFMEALRLTFIGFFFNTAMPGLTGGDVVKAFYVSRGSRSPYAAFLSVFVDRAIGLFGLIILAGVVLVGHLGEPGFREAGVWVFASLAGGTLCGCVLFSRRIRRWLRVDAWLPRLPLGSVLGKIDQAIIAYRDAPRTVAISVGLSVLNHGGTILLTILIGRAVGIENPASHFFVIAPVCFLIASVPLLPGGWGVREGAFAYFFARVGVPVESSVACSVLLGLSQQFWYLLGGPVFIARPDRVSTSAIAEFSAELRDGTPRAAQDSR